MASNYSEFVEEAKQSINSKEDLLGKGKLVPNNSTNSGSRKIMVASQLEAAMVLLKGEPPLMQTGHENRFGEKSASILATDEPNHLNSSYDVIAKVSKFDYAPNHFYWLILRDIYSKKLKLIERCPYKINTEVYGYLYNNTVLDSYAYPGRIIPQGTILRTSTGFDQYNNMMYGTNLNTAYLASDQNMEDSVEISETCAKKCASQLIIPVELILNENDIPLNLYGNDSVYKIHPDIGEEIKNGTLLAYRREKRDEAIYTQSVHRLQQIMMSDDRITVKSGKVIDIDLYCNNPEHLKNSIYNQQFLMYYNNRIRCATEIVNAVGPFISQGYELGLDLEYLFKRSKDEINEYKFVAKKAFSNLYINFVVMDIIPMGVGDKIADRYGGKGVVSKVVPDELMPKLPNGRPVEIIKNSSTMYNRENAGQVFEVEVNYISMCILDRIRDPKNGYTPETAWELILQFLDLQSPKQAEYMRAIASMYTQDQLAYFVNTILEKPCIPISNEPISEAMTIDKLALLYKTFPWINQQYLQVPIKDSNGNYRFIPTRRPIIVAPIYHMRLKQFAEEKFSATSLSSTNLRGENARSKASKNHRAPNSTTPIKFGQMETGDLNHIGTEYVVINLLLHSLSPHGRRLVEQIVLGDPYDVDVKLDSISKNRAAEILNARLKTMGYRLVFEKEKKTLKVGITRPGLIFDDGPNGLREGLSFHEDGYDYEHYYKTIEEVRKRMEKSGIRIEGLEFMDSGEENKEVAVEDLLKAIAKPTTIKK